MGSIGADPFTYTQNPHILDRHVAGPVHPEHSPHTEGPFLVQLCLRSEGVPGPQGPRPVRHQEHPPLHHRDPARRVPRPQARVGKLESQMFDRPRRAGTAPLTPVLPDAHDRIFTLGYTYMPVHTEIYGTYRAQTARMS